MNKYQSKNNNFYNFFKKRSPFLHKGDNGTICLIGGSESMVGSIILASRAALKIGAGKVLVGFTQSNIPMNIDILQPELMLNSVDFWIKSNIHIDSFVIGCGLGQKNDYIHIINKIIKNNIQKPILLDADCLNLISTRKIILNNFNSNIIITPHPLEASRLMNTDVEYVQKNREKTVIDIANFYKTWVILKGHNTLICNPYGKIIFINKTGNVGLATSGSGDILSGIIGSLLAQKISIEESILSGVWVHGYAADNLVKKNIGPIGLTATELIDEIRNIRNTKKSNF
ncbi:Bifunctional NAD(P)H-hydrate repair enzyme Nnr [Candidatus Kinetoplastibacterium sorsogonicusi]|uniref:ADP-dependent (S)-NAD(P)H-hydrate dehydratase n=1 Tax=Candidatus Kinetoplastidibacterium kentomonadis TaxID=1576550 RepID=A0A3Q8ETV7_9PROT|nr:NAD(P)H-hydrate dehydratase [Candidatus Kinetoplastibacterium sorsogonicusi]AWD32203.1 Bifunctional NAD(P)H-hydrate repair enzyme Nnr [Candidatus Kinetoplastibacterium sorsogonicusi]